MAIRGENPTNDTEKTKTKTKQKQKTNADDVSSAAGGNGRPTKMAATDWWTTTSDLMVGPVAVVV